ncbi:hypothetical protein [Bradyrhizobium sp. CCBAU 53415]|uniref:hypothetical protein n=1 Tax=Bradyrhizobium sp. CCBAU 53415 TaxID=1325119 RepID=UPI0023062845|nr:hypothetical protein [Bradyrhizobium sp. CCBAU 53415]
MNDNSLSAMRELQGLRIMRVFVRIDDAALRRSVIELAECLAQRHLQPRLRRLMANPPTRRP